MSTSLRRLFGLALALMLCLPFLVPAAPALAAPVTWVVAFNTPNSLPQNVDAMVAKASGTITVRIPEIGGIAVSSSSPNFRAAMAANPQVLAVAEAVTASVPGTDDDGTNNGYDNSSQFSPAGPDPQPGSEPLYNQQWDKMRINASDSGSYAVQRGRKDVAVAVIDTGTDMTHPDIAPNLDVARSRSFVPTEPTVQDGHGHGTHTMSTVGAPINGFGISGVAPNVTLVSLKTLSEVGSGLFVWTDQALVYAGQNHFDVASMSLGGYIPKCGALNPNNPNACDHPDYILLTRAVQFARLNGVLPVAALGNDNFNLSDGDFVRDYVEAPGEIAGVVGVAATGYYNRKSYYSNYGVGMTDLSAPGGDRRFQLPPPPYLGGGRVLAAIPAVNHLALPPTLAEEECEPGPGGPCAWYGWLQGTSMATPQVSGVAALIISQYGDFLPSNQTKPHMAPTEVEQILQTTANNQPCPEPNYFDPGPPSFPATCQGDTGYNNFYGKGIVDALKAVTAFPPSR